MEKRKKSFFIIEVIAVLMMIFMCGCGTVSDIRQITSGGYSGQAEEVYDAKTQTYVTQSQADMNYFCDFWVKRVLLGFTLLCLVGGFIFRRIDHVNAILRSKALFIEVGVPVLYIIFAYGICYFADNFV